MKTNYSIFYALPLFFLFSCMRTGDTILNSSIQLKSFHGIPGGFIGCTCYFASTEKNLRNEEFYFISDQDSSARVSINDRQVQLRLVESTKNNDNPEKKDYIEKYTDGTYTLIITVHYKENEADEVWLTTSDVKLLFKEMEVDRKKLVGECGC
jgi:hypothetical protein